MLHSSKPKKVISVNDPAINFNETGYSNLRKYAEERDINHLKLKETEQPTYFYLMPIKTNVFENFVQGATTDGEKLRRAFQLAVVKIENFMDRYGNFHKEFKPEGEINGPQGEIKHLDEDQMELVSPQEKEEIGEVAYKDCFLAPKVKKRYHLSAISNALLLDQIYRDAEENLLTAQESKQKAQKGSENQPEKSGEKDTDAPAKDQ